MPSLITGGSRKYSSIFREHVDILTHNPQKGQQEGEDAKIMTLPVGWYRTAPMEKVHYLPVSNMASWEITKLSGGL